MLITNKGEILTLELSLLPFLFKGTKMEETTDNLHLSTHTQKNYFYLQVTWVLTPWWDAAFQVFV